MTWFIFGLWVTVTVLLELYTLCMARNNLLCPTPTADVSPSGFFFSIELPSLTQVLSASLYVGPPLTASTWGTISRPYLCPPHCHFCSDAAAPTWLRVNLKGALLPKNQMGGRAQVLLLYCSQLSGASIFLNTPSIQVLEQRL